MSDHFFTSGQTKRVWLVSFVLAMGSFAPQIFIFIERFMLQLSYSDTRMKIMEFSFDLTYTS